MKLHYEPTVYFVGVPQISQEQLDKFLADHGVTWESDTDSDAELIPETAGRVCYMSFSKPRPGGNQAYLKHILEVGHGSVLEHTNFNFIFTGVSRSLTHELVRHRAGWAYSQLSQRYVDESVAEYVVPWEYKNEVQEGWKFLNWMCEKYLWSGTTLQHISRILAEVDRKNWTFAAWPITEGQVMGLHWLWDVLTDTESYRKHSLYLFDKIEKEAYAEFIKRATDNNTKIPNFIPWTFPEWKSHGKPEDKTTYRKQARQAARSVLPNATETKVFCTANVRAIRHFIEMRGSRHADHEIRQLAYKIWQAVVAEAPNLFSDYQWKLDGTFPLDVTTEFRKV